MMKKGLIIGKGWLGSLLENHLKSSFLIETTKRKSDAENCFSIDFDDYKNEKIESEYDFIIITIPFGRRNSEEDLIRRFNHLASYLGDYKNQLFLLNSTAIYPDIDAEISENSIESINLINPYYLIENQLKEFYNQLTILRLGGLMGDDRFLSKYIKFDHQNLNQVVNHIHYFDICQIIEKMINTNKNSSIYNVVSPIHPTKEEVINYQINNEIVESKECYGKRISSKKIIDELEYEFTYPNPIYFPFS